MNARVEELADNRVRVIVEVPREDVKHAIDHAAADLAGSMRIPGFRKGKVPLPVLMARLGRERVYSEAVDSHIQGWFLNAVASKRIRPIAQPEYEFELPESEGEGWSFTATVDVQPKLEPPDWTTLEVPAPEPEVPGEAVDAELDTLRSMVAELAPVEGRPAKVGDTLVVDVVEPSGATQHDLVFELGSGRLLEEIETGLVGAPSGETKTIEVELADDSRHPIEVTVKEIKEKILPPVDDELARAASEFDTLAELRADIEGRLRELLEAELETAFRADVADALVEAAVVEPSGPLVNARSNQLWRSLQRSLEARGVSAEAYLQISGQSVEQVQERLRAEAARSIGRELVLEAVADKLGIEISDEELENFVREDVSDDGEDPASVLTQLRETGRIEQLREDLRLRRALDRVAAEVKRIPVELAHAREKLWTPDKERTPAETKLWTPGSKEPA